MTEQVSYYLLSWYLREQTAQDTYFVKPSLFITHSPAITVHQCVPQWTERKSKFQKNNLFRRQRNTEWIEKPFLNHKIWNCITENHLSSYVKKKYLSHPYFIAQRGTKCCIKTSAMSKNTFTVWNVEYVNEKCNFFTLWNIKYSVFPCWTVPPMNTPEYHRN